MRSLWVKIFLWFWLAMSLVGGSLVLFNFVAGPPQPPGPFGSPPFVRNWRQHAVLTLRQETKRGVDILRQGGLKDLVRHLDELENSTGIRGAIFNSQGEELTGRSYPPPATNLVRKTQKIVEKGFPEGEAQMKGPEGMLLAARTLALRGNLKTFTLVAQVPPPVIDRRLAPRDLILRLLAILITGGAVCLWLARHLTTPLVRLQRAVRQLSGGDLSTRMGQVLEPRGDEFSDLARDFDLMAERIQSLLGSQQRLLRDISHELRSPLARLGVAVELARKHQNDSPSKALDRIELEADRMNIMIGQLLDLTRLENTDQMEEMGLVPLADLLEEIVEDANFEAAGYNRTVRLIEIQKCTVKGSPQLLRSALENVIRNGVRHTPEHTEVQISLIQSSKGQQTYQLIRVRDWGLGVPDSALSELFRPFYRVEDARDRQSGGSGLGLAIAEQIVRLHGGFIRATNASEGGLIVEIELETGSPTVI